MVCPRRSGRPHASGDEATSATLRTRVTPCSTDRSGTRSPSSATTGRVGNRQTRDRRADRQLRDRDHRSIRGTAAGPLPAQVRLDERVEIAVEHTVDVAGLVLGAEVLHELVRREHVAADLAAEPDALLLALDGDELLLALLALEVGESRLAASSSPGPGSGTGCARPDTTRRCRSACGSAAPPTTSC